MEKQIISVIFLLLFIGKITYPQNINTAGIFPTIDHSGKLNNKLDYSIYYFSAFPVFTLQKEKVVENTFFNIFYAEHAISYTLFNNFSLTGSYVYQRENVFQTNYVNENRFYSQIKFKHNLNKLVFTHRLRFDGRFIQNRFSNKTPFTHRLRYLIGMDIPLNQKLYFTTYEEPFFNTITNSNIIYSENWAYAAFGKKIDNKNKIEVGLLFVTWNIGNRNWFNQYYLQLSWINQLDFRNTNK